MGHYSTMKEDVHTLPPKKDQKGSQAETTENLTKSYIVRPRTTNMTAESVNMFEG